MPTSQKIVNVLSAISISMAMCGSCIGLYHQYILLPMVEEKAKERDIVLGHQILNELHAKFIVSYEKIPTKQPHQIERLENLKKAKEFHYNFHVLAIKDGLAYPLDPPE